MASDNDETRPLLANRRPRGYAINDDPSTSTIVDCHMDDGASLTESQIFEHVRKSGEPIENINAELESLDYDTCENALYLAELEEQNSHRKITLCRWVINFGIGVLTATIAFFIDYSIQNLSAVKYHFVKKSFDYGITYGWLVLVSLVIWLLWNVTCVSIASFCTAFFEPVAAGSGIPQIKCYLNGIKIPRVVRIRTLATKVSGVILSVVGGLAIGKEGPMIHSGSVVAAGISQGRSTSFRFDPKLFEFFRTDQEKRDFVASGAAAGVAAAFGAPIGGLLFALEEGASFWHQNNTWRAFFASLVSAFTLSVLQSIAKGQPMQLTYSGLINFGSFKNEELDYGVFEIILVYPIMGVIGGLLGALFNSMNQKLTVFRQKYVHNRWVQVAEAAIVAQITTLVAFVTLYVVNDCQPIGKDPNITPLQVFCEDGHSSSMATMWMQTPEESVKSLFHDQLGTYKAVTLAVFFGVYFFLAVWTYGVTVPSGLFIPALLTGAAWGRLLGIALHTLFPTAYWTASIGKFALIGATAQLGGVVRMTLSLCVIVAEASGITPQYGIPLMIVVIIAKTVGDLFNEGLYDIHIKLAGVPFLEWEPPVASSHVTAEEVMSHPVTTLRQHEKVARIQEVLLTEPHNGFPVVIDFNPAEAAHGGTFGTLVGMINRTQLIVLLENKAFYDQDPAERLNLKDFRQAYPRYPKIEDIQLTDEEQRLDLNLSKIMNPAPYVVSNKTSLPRIFRLFRGLGLRHIPVVNAANQVLGIVTRKDLARYKRSHGGDLVQLFYAFFPKSR